MLISACLIVKNEAEMLKKTLPNLVATLDEVIVVDTGSTDDTVAVVSSFGARIFHFAWCNDFSAARNVSLQQAHGDWILWIDADEFMEKDDLLQLRKELQEAKASCFQLLIYECIPFTPSRGETCYHRTKVFRNFIGAHFNRPINEQLVDRESQILNGKPLNMPIFHFGNKLSQEKMEEKKNRNVRIFSEAIKSNPFDPHYHLHLADSYKALKQTESALTEYQIAADLFISVDLRVRALMGKARCLYQTGQKESASCTIEQILELNPQSAEALNLKAVLLLEAKQIQPAIEILNAVIQISVPLFSDTSIKTEQYNFLPYFLLGNAFLLSGQISQALAAFESAYKANPSSALAEKIANLNHKVKEVTK